MINTQSRISEFKFRIKNLKKDFTIRDIIECYSVPFLFVFKKHYLEYWTRCGEVFARCPLAKPDLFNGQTINKGVIYFNDWVGLESMLQTDIVYPLVCDKVRAWNDFALLFDVFAIMPNNEQLLSYFRTHKKTETGFEETVNRVVLELLKEGNEKAASMFAWLIRELDKTTDREFMFSQVKIYDEAVREFDRIIKINKSKESEKVIVDLLCKYYDGTASDEEIKKANEWLDERPGRRNLCNDMMKSDDKKQTRQVMQIEQELKLKNRGKQSQT